MAQEKAKPTKILNDEAAQRLASAIVLQAAEDYKNAYQGYKTTLANGTKQYANHMLEDCERFFFSEWCETLTDINTEKLVKDIKKTELKRVLMFYKNFLKCAGNTEIRLKIRKHGTWKKDHVFKVTPRLMDGFIQIIGLQYGMLKEQYEQLDD